jgi:transglutaminase-like putative cysteine protease
MKKLLTLTIIFLMLPLTLATNYNTYEDLTIDFSLDSEIFLSGPGSLNNLNANVFLIPLEDSIQSVNTFSEHSTPTGESDKSPDLLRFTWTEQATSYEFGYDSVIKTQNRLFQVPEINFPYSSLPEEYNEYVQASEIIDINSDIINQASEIIASEDNAYLAVHEIADWVYNNIEYDLNTVTAKAAKQSSWVLDNRQGVCDEITSLFISMTRSIGIPARFVSGVAYTNLYNEFGNHGWAEVYYPEYGWVPYDVTFDQFGWIDPTHVALQKTVDAGSSSITYNWEANGDVSLETGEIISQGEITSMGNEKGQIFDINLHAVETEVAPGSYVPIRVRVMNPFSGYVSDQLTVTKAPDLTDKNVKVVALGPKQTKDTFWIVKIPDDAENGYIYTTTIEVRDTFNSLDSEEITFSPDADYEYISLEEAEEMVDSMTVDEEDRFSSQVVLTCVPDKDYYYSFSAANIECNVRSLNDNLNHLEICLGEICDEFALPKSSEEDFTFPIVPSNEPIVVNLKNSEIDVKRVILLNFLEKPEITVARIGLNSLNYGEPIDIPLTVSSQTPVKDVTLNMNRFQPIIIDELDGTKTFTISTNTKFFNAERISIKITFEDEEGNFYEDEYTQQIKVNNLPWYWSFINIFRS